MIVVSHSITLCKHKSRVLEVRVWRVSEGWEHLMQILHDKLAAGLQVSDEGHAVADFLQTQGARVSVVSRIQFAY